MYYLQPLIYKWGIQLFTLLLMLRKLCACVKHKCIKLLKLNNFVLCHSSSLSIQLCPIFEERVLSLLYQNWKSILCVNFKIKHWTVCNLFHIFNLLLCLELWIYRNFSYLCIFNFSTKKLSDFSFTASES